MPKEKILIVEDEKIVAMDIRKSVEARGNARYYKEALSGKSTILSQGLHGYLIPMPSDCAQNLFECIQQTAQIMPVKKGDRVTGVVTFIADVTERLEREANLSASERRYRTLVENARDAVFVVQEERLETANPAARDLFGLSGLPHEKENDFARLRNAVDPVFWNRLEQRFQDRVAGKPIKALFAYPIRRPQGDPEVQWIESNSALIEWEGRPKRDTGCLFRGSP